MSTPHTPEPWKVYQPRVKQYIRNGADHFVLEPSQYGWRNPADAHRAVACVNACTGIADPEATIPMLVGALKLMVTAYDFKSADPMKTYDPVQIVAQARAALKLAGER